MPKTDNREFISLNIAVLTVSDTRTKATDRSGRLLAERVTQAGHNIVGEKIVGDDIYGGKHLKVSDIVPRGVGYEKDRIEHVIQRQALHAGYLAFTHPITDMPVEFTAPLHGDMAELVKMLRLHRFKKAPTLPNAIIDLDDAVKYEQ